MFMNDKVIKTYLIKNIKYPSSFGIHLFDYKKNAKRDI